MSYFDDLMVFRSSLSCFFYGYCVLPVYFVFYGPTIKRTTTATSVTLTNYESEVDTANHAFYYYAHRKSARVILVFLQAVN